MLLGNKTEYKFGYDPDLLETFENPHPDNDYWVRFNCPEFKRFVQSLRNPILQLYTLSTFPTRK